MKLLLTRADFKEKAKFRLLRNCVMRVKYLFSFALYRAPSNYEELTRVVSDFESGTRVFRSATVLSEEVPSSSIAPASRMMVRPDSRVRNLECKIDSLTEKLAELSLIVKASTERVRGGGSSDRFEMQKLLPLQRA